MKKTTPYVYKVTHLWTGQYYYGCRYTEGCDPLEGFNIYATSSWVVKQMIKNAPEEWHKEVLFEGTKETVLIEEASLIRLATNDPNCLNGNTLVNSVRKKEKHKKELIFDSNKVQRTIRELGKLIRSTRKSKKLNATETSKAANISRVTLHRIEVGTSSVTMGSIINVLTILELDHIFDNLF